MNRNLCVLVLFAVSAARADDAPVKVTAVKPELRKIKPRRSPGMFARWPSTSATVSRRATPS